MKDLLVRGVSWSADLAGVHDGTHILDVVENDISRLAIDLVILSASDGCYVRCDAGVDYYIFFTGVLIEGKASQDLEATAVVEVV